MVYNGEELPISLPDSDDWRKTRSNESSQKIVFKE
jgi:hypothetical protein